MDEDKGFKEMSFSAINLTESMKGKPKEEIFVYKDMPLIKILDKDVVYDKLMGFKKKKGDSNTG